MRPKDRRVISAWTFAGDPVRNPDGRRLGDLKDILIDTLNGRIAYAVLGLPGLADVGDRLLPVPWSLLRVDGAGQSFVLDVSEETLKNAPDFDRNHWPDFADPDWGAGIYAYYCAKPYW